MKCLECGKDTSNPKFCGRSCSASYNNRITKKKDQNHCLSCGEAIARDKKFCNNVCQQDYQFRTKGYFRFLEGKVLDPKALRRALIEHVGYECVMCGLSEWQGKPITLQVDHKDGNSDNNLPSNLRLLCPNCHSQTPTYKGGNRKNLKMDKRNVQKRLKYAEARDNGAYGQRVKAFRS